MINKKLFGNCAKIRGRDIEILNHQKIKVLSFKICFEF